MNLIITGPQASGKGTQASLLKDKLGLIHLSMGEIFRKIARKKIPLGRKVDEYINQKGLLVPEEITTEIVKRRLSKTSLKKGIIFDGYPRTRQQLGILGKLMEEKNAKIDRVFYIKVLGREIQKRLSGRMVCPQCEDNYNLLTKPPKKKGLCDNCEVKLIRRKDESPEAIKNRLAIYHQQTAPLLDYYRQKGILEEVDGQRPIEVIFADILARLKKAGITKK